MAFKMLEILCCPIDGQPLREQTGSLRCESGHSFDIARRGYVNLLAASDKRSKDPGDNREMVAARSAFLDAGHYLPVAQKLNELVSGLAAPESVIVDAGCGEGYYLQQLSLGWGDSGPAMVGYDISKWAVQAAARRFDATWLVASNRNIPLADNSVDVLLSIFGFPSYESFSIALKDGGSVVLVTAGPRHLYELREVIYPQVKVSESGERRLAENAGFSFQQSIGVQYQTEPLSQLEISQLLHMTPHLFRATSEGRDKAQTLDQFSVTVDVVFDVVCWRN